MSETQPSCTHTRCYCFIPLSPFLTQISITPSSLSPRHLGFASSFSPLHSVIRAQCASLLLRWLLYHPQVPEALYSQQVAWYHAPLLAWLVTDSHTVRMGPPANRDWQSSTCCLDRKFDRSRLWYCIETKIKRTGVSISARDLMPEPAMFSCLSCLWDPIEINNCFIWNTWLGGWEGLQILHCSSLSLEFLAFCIVRNALRHCFCSRGDEFTTANESRLKIPTSCVYGIRLISSIKSSGFALEILASSRCNFSLWAEVESKSCQPLESLQRFGW